MQRIVGISQGTETSLIFHNYIYKKENYFWLQLLNETSWWWPSSQIYVFFYCDTVLILLANCSSCMFLISRLLFSFRHSHTFYFSFHLYSSILLFPYSGVCLYACIFHMHFLSVFICVDISLDLFFKTLFLSLHCWSYHYIVCLTAQKSVHYPSCFFPSKCFQSTLNIFSFYSHRALSLQPSERSMPIFLTLVYLSDKLHLHNNYHFHHLMWHLLLWFSVTCHIKFKYLLKRCWSSIALFPLSSTLCKELHSLVRTG